MTPNSKIKVKNAGERSIEGSSVSAAFHMLDNHRSFSHAAFPHKPDAVVSADELFEIYKFENDLRKKRAEEKKREQEIKSPSSLWGKNLASMFADATNNNRAEIITPKEYKELINHIHLAPKTKEILAGNQIPMPPEPSKDTPSVTPPPADMPPDEDPKPVFIVTPKHIPEVTPQVDIRGNQDILFKKMAGFDHLLPDRGYFNSLRTLGYSIFDELYRPRPDAFDRYNHESHYYMNGKRQYLHRYLQDFNSKEMFWDLDTRATYSLWRASKTIKSYIDMNPDKLDSPLSQKMMKGFLDEIAKMEPPQPRVDEIYEAQFADRQRVKVVPLIRDRSKLEAAWNTQQKEIRQLEKNGKIKHSIHDEDVLGDFDSWVANRPDDVQYLMMGDTNHQDENVQAWINDGKYMQALKKNGYADLVIERPASAEKPVQDYIKGKIGIADLRSQLKELNVPPFSLIKLAKSAKDAGIMLHMFDEQLLDKRNTRIDTFWVERRDHDIDMAEKIKERFGDKRLAVIYGAAHFQHEGWMTDKLGKEKCAVVNVHKDLQEYKHSLRWNVAMPAPCTLVLEEEKVVASHGRYGRNIPANLDHVTGSIRRVEQKKEIELFEGKVRDYSAGVEKSYITPAEVVRLAQLTWAKTKLGTSLPSGLNI